MKTRVIIEGDGVSPVPERVLGCAARIGEEIADELRRTGDNLPWAQRDFATNEQYGLFPSDGEISIRVEHDGELVSEHFVCLSDELPDQEEDFF